MGDESRNPMRYPCRSPLPESIYIGVSFLLRMSYMKDLPIVGREERS